MIRQPHSTAPRGLHLHNKNGRVVMTEDRDHVPFATLETDDKVSRNSTVTSDNPKTVVLLRRQPLCVLLFCTALLSIACVILASVVVLRWRCQLGGSRAADDARMSAHMSNVCSTKDCLRDSVNILRSLKEDIDPCDDFAGFACDGGVSEYRQKQDIMLAKLRDLVERVQVPNAKNSAVRKWRDYYTSCLYGLNQERENIAVRLSLEKLGGWQTADGIKIDPIRSMQTWDLTEALITLRKRLGMKGHVFFDHCCGQEGSEITISGYWKGHFCTNPDVGTKRLYVQTVARLLGFVDYDTFAEGVLTVDDEVLCRSSQDSDQWSTLTVTQLSEMFPSINWTRYIGEVHNPQRIHEITVRIWHRSHFRQLSKELTRLMQQPHTKRQLRDYLVFGFIVNNMNILPQPYDDAEKSYLQAINSPLLALKSTERWKPRSRWRWCLHGGQWQDSVGYSRYLNQLSPITASMMVRTTPQHLSNINRAAEVMRDYWSRMRIILVKRIENSTRLDEQAKSVVKSSIENIHLNVGLPSWITDEKELNKAYEKLEIDGDSPSFYDNGLAVLRFDDVIDARTLHASQASNLLSTHGSTDGEMQADLGYGALIEYYERQTVKSTLLGSLGVRLGDLLTFPVRLGSDASSHLSDQNREDWKACVTDALRDAIRPEWKKSLFISDFGTAGSETNSQLKRRVEYFSQTLMGFEVSWTLYRRVVAENAADVRRTLPGLNYSPDQLFFITTAQMGCYGQPTDDTLTDDYVYTKLKTNAMMSLMPTFAEAFQCDKNTRMRRDKQCPIWAY